MKSFFSKYRPEDEWLIKECKWEQKLQPAIESQFTLGNGFIASRGILEEVPFDSRPGTYIAGLYDKTGAQVPELVNLPNPINFKVIADGEQLGAGTMDIIEHERCLDMRSGAIIRHTVYRNSHKKRFDYQSFRFVSMHNRHIIAMKVCITALDEAAAITIENLLDLSVTNVGVLTEGNKKHFRIENVSPFDLGEYLSVRTLENNIVVAYGKALCIEKGGVKQFARNVATYIKLKKNQTVFLTAIFSVFTSEDKKPYALKNRVKNFLRKSVNIDFEKMIEDHIAKWSKLWDISDVKIKGAPETEKAIRFNIYHLLICGREGNGESSIGAKTLSGEGYRGHIFWDAEIFMLPFFIYNRPMAAKNMLLYRYYRLGKAREIAENRGYKGAMFPWESAGTGEEATPAWAKNYDGSLIKIRTHELEQHITADIAYAVYHYYNVTGDENFMVKYGFEMLFETARFWASRVEYNPKSRRYDINHVIGPDEFHEDVDNNAYTNYLARFNLLIACGMYQRMRRFYPTGFERLSRKINLKEAETRLWKNIVPKVYFKIKDNGLIEQFEGFFRKKKVVLKGFDKNPIPDIPKTVKLKDIGKTQLVKQADVIMLLYLFSDNFNKNVKSKNIYYYLKHTVHKSSLSAGVHAALLTELGDIKTACKYFDVAVNSDLNMIYGNTNDGMHAASLGVTWQAAIHGFAGVKVINGMLSILPSLPEGWKEMTFSLKWRGCDITIKAANNRVSVHAYSKREKDVLKIKVFGMPHKIEVNRAKIFIK